MENKNIWDKILDIAITVLTAIGHYFLYRSIKQKIGIPYRYTYFFYYWD